MVRDYEIMYIARPELDEEGLQGAVDSVEQIINAAGGSVVRTTNWGRRRLAYEVDHMRDGHYMLLDVRLDGSRVTDVERALAIHDTVFRHLLVVREAGDESEPEVAGAAAPLAAAPLAAAGSGATGEVRQAVVAAVADDDADEDDNDDDDDDVPAAVHIADEEEN